MTAFWMLTAGFALALAALTWGACRWVSRTWRDNVAMIAALREG